MKPIYDEPLSIFALKFNLRRYIMSSPTATVRSVTLVLLVYVAAALSGEAGRRGFASHAAPCALLLFAAAWLASLHAVRRRRVARQGFFFASKHSSDVESPSRHPHICTNIHPEVTSCSDIGPRTSTHPTLNLPLVMCTSVRAFTLKVRVSHALISVRVVVLDDPATRRHFTSMTMLTKEEGRADWVGQCRLTL